MDETTKSEQGNLSWPAKFPREEEDPTEGSPASVQYSDPLPKTEDAVIAMGGRVSFQVRPLSVL